MEMKNYLIDNHIRPYRLIFRSKFYIITEIPTKFDIDNYVVKTVDGKIDRVIIKSPHPNARPKTGDFCIPNSMRRRGLNKQTANMITYLLSVFNLDDCYFTPWDEIKYKKQEVCGTWKQKK